MQLLQMSYAKKGERNLTHLTQLQVLLNIVFKLLHTVLI